MDKREMRRDRTWRTGERRQKLHLARVHPPDPMGIVKLDCVCERSAYRFAKQKALGGCRCSKKAKGRPKYGHGICLGWDLRPTVKARRQWSAESKDPLKDY
jgi:hypothetical protein